MPIFEYRCRACGEEFEAFLTSVSDAPRCPGCGGTELQKKISVPACGASGCAPSTSGFS